MLNKQFKVEIHTMSGKPIFRQNQGTLFLAMLIMIAVGGMMATRLLPSRTIQEKRDKAYQLRMALGQIRQAVDLKYMADPAYNPDFSSAINIKNALKDLSNENYLRSDKLKDPTIPNYLWELNDGYYWQGTNNMAENTSFENTKDGEIATWVAVLGSTVATTPYYLDSSEIDSFPDQNNLGVSFNSSGTAVAITK